MSREILFRGKSVDNGEWFEGYLSKSRNISEKPALLKLCIDCEEKGVMASHIIVPETAGQFTGLTDKNGKKIFEGDIIEFDCDSLGVIEWDEDCAKFAIHYDENILTDFDSYYGFNCEVVGNIYDNPELLEA